MTGTPVQGGLSRAGGSAVGMVQGWCWSADRPAERLTVALLIDGVQKASVVAARLRSELVRPGLCDGYHGFSLALPADLAPTARIEAMECGSGQVFARIVPAETAESLAWAAQAEAAYVTAATLQEALPDWAGTPRWSTLGPALAETGRHFARHPLSELQLPAAPHLPVIAQPRFTLLLDAGSDPAAGRAGILAIAPLLRRYLAELLVYGDGHGAQHVNDAAAQARGDTLVFLRAGQIAPRDLAILLDAAQGRSDSLLGGAAQMAARQAGFRDPFPAMPAKASRSGLSLLTPRSLFEALGGFDLTMADGADLPMLDFALRAEDAGHTVLAWGDAAVPDLSPGPQAATARGNFLAYWVN
ncbi:glycosyltransferase family protein [Acidisoma silvae]|uniref:Uncharacterized protein n=1 Tax=Acidisoma silvae TaxID=2802396 RepID=A0A964DX46_9PROT|nr:hypothetical protein [Acidisoma silvae]MCB8873617.1 hypothetical protein [Acidisoma silvae]